MTQNSALYCLRASISLAFKTPSGPQFGEFQRTYGAGFNACLEVAWTWTESLDKAALEAEFLAFVKKIDHKHLGLDEPELGITTPESLLQVAAAHFEDKKTPVRSVRLSRGEDIQYRLDL